MVKKTGRVLLVVLLLLSGGANLVAQEEPSAAAAAEPAVSEEGALSPDSSGETPARPAPGAEILQQMRDRIDADTSLGDLQKAAQLGQIDEALGLLEEAEASTKTAEAHRSSLQNSPAEIAEHRREIAQIGQQLQALSEEGIEPLPPGELDEAVNDVNSRLQALSEQLTEVNEQLVELRTRPDLARKELDQAQAQIKELNIEITAQNLNGRTPSELTPADALLLARIEALRRREVMLQQELLSQDARRNSLLARQELLEDQVELARARLQALKTLQDAQLSDQVRQARQVVDAAEDSFDDLPQSEALNALAADTRETAAQLEDVAVQLRKTTGQLVAASSNLSVYQRDFLDLRSQYELLKAHGAFGETLLQQYRRLPDMNTFAARERSYSRRLADARLQLFYLGQGILNEQEMETRAAELAADAAGENQDPQTLATLKNQVLTILRQRQQLRTQLAEQYQRLIRELTQLDALNRQSRALVEDIQAYIQEKLLYARSSPRISGETFLKLPASFLPILNPRGWLETLQQLARTPLDAPIGTFLLACALGLLLYLRPFCRKTIAKSNRRIKRISTDKLFYTVQALLATLLLAAPLPMLLALIGWRLHWVANSNIDLAGPDFIEALWRIIGWVWPVLLVAFFLLRATRPNGIFIQHFRFTTRPVARVHHALWMSLPIYVLSMLTIGFTIWDSQVLAFNSLGRLVFMANMAWLTFIAWYLFHPNEGIFAERIAADPASWLSHLRWLWVVLAMLFPVTLFLAAASGYVLAAIQQQVKLERTLFLGLIGTLVYQLVNRWLFKTERRHMLEERLKTWNADKSADDASTPAGDDIEEAASIEIEQAVISMERISQHTRNLMKFAVQVSILLLLWFLFSGYFTGVRKLDTMMIAGSMSWADLLRAFFIILPTIILVKNIPGLLDGVLLQHLPITPGSRYAVSTLVQYAVLILGLVIGIAQLGVDWSVLGWAAAALSVGIGFGLQEIVSNFICGLILLFERPIRVGDVVTMGTTTGVVSRIQIRATTITNYDRMEVVIPNKAFVTGEFTNWTLSNSVNRVLVTVGVAYGSDVEKASEIIVQAARDNPFTIDDPEPSVTFEQFADSSLNLVLRAYLPDMENRLSSINKLHTTINNRLNDAGIEIAFPQRDLHLRSIDSKTLQHIAKPQAEGDEGEESPSAPAASGDSDK